MKIDNRKSIQFHFNLGLGFVITIIILVLSLILIMYNSFSIRKDINARLNLIVEQSRLNLSNAIWNMELSNIDEHLNSIFLDKDVICIQVFSGSADVVMKVHPDFKNVDFHDLSKLKDFIAKEKKILYNGETIGKVRIIMSTRRVYKQTVGLSIIAILFLLLIVSAIFYTNHLLSRKYIFKPLKKLEISAGKIASGDLNTKIDTTSKGEIGKLAETFDIMMENIKSITASRNELNQEIEERKAAEGALRESEENFRLLVETVKDYAIFRLNPDGIIASWNVGAQLIKGYKAEEVIGQHFSILYPKSDVEAGNPTKILKKAIEKGRFEITGWRVRRDGTKYITNDIITALFDRNGNLKGFSEVTKDVTKQKKSEYEIHAIFNTVVSGLSLVDKNFNIMKVNSSFLKLSGLEEKKVIGKKCYDIFSGELCKTDNCPLQRLLNDQKDYFEEEIRQTRIDGKKILTSVTATPFFDYDGDFVGIVESFTDLTEREKAQKEKSVLEKELHQAQKLEAIGTLAAGIAHEINTPIQFIGNNTGFMIKATSKLFTLIKDYQDILANIVEFEEPELLAKKLKKIEKKAKLPYLQKEVPLALNQTSEGVERVAKIVKAMKEFSYVGNDNMAQENINNAIESTIPISRNEWKYVAEMKTDLDPSLPLVECCIGDIKQVLLNLIINAAHAIADALAVSGEKLGLIFIRTYAKDGSVFILVGDTGSGIPEEIRDKIFEHFFTTKEVGKGTGQGLSMAYRTIVEKHKGKLTFETKIGKGTTFIIELPITAASAEKK